MTIRLTNTEKKIAKKLTEIKKKSSSHSPSPAMLLSVKGITVKYDFCYLSNPYATELFLKYFNKDTVNSSRFRKLVEYYPSQNRVLAEKLEQTAGVPAKNIFVGNGATEIIQAVLQNFVRKKILVPVPTFSPYLEFVPKGVRAVRHQLFKENQFRLNLNELIAQVRKEKLDAAVIINPNNPDGGQIAFSGFKKLIGSLRNLETVIVDESFIHFSGRKMESVSKLVEKYPNLIVVKSLSKDFGIAGLRLGYAVMSESRVSKLLERGFLWNVSGFGEYFLGLLNRGDFMCEYEKVRLLAVKERDDFFTALSKIPEIKVYPSKANMFLVELRDGSRAQDLMVKLLVEYGIYVRLCADKVGLKGEFVRVASRKKKENNYFIRALVSIFRGV